MSERIIYRFTRDLRLGDHAGLAAALKLGEIVPVLTIDAQLVSRLRASPRRATFFCNAVTALASALHERGGTLVVRRGPAFRTLRQLALATGARGVAWMASYDGRGIAADRGLQSSLEEAQLRALIIHDAPAISPEETAEARPSSGTGYRSFTPFFDLWNALPVAPLAAPLQFASVDIASEALPLPNEFDAKADTAMLASEAAARERLRRFLDGPALAYSIARNVPAAGSTSSLSAHLSFGTIAARTVVEAVRTRMASSFLLTEERLSLRTFMRSLAQRDFFLQLAWNQPQTEDRPLQHKMRDFSFAREHAALAAWKEGKTGYPLVDAGMRELLATGWMHPRIRAVSAAFLCFDLGVDWRVGRDAWDRELIEDDPALATGNWQWIAGIGADLAAYPRIYNPIKQARTYDPNGTYIRRWLPELENIPSGVLLDPFVRERRAQTELPLFGVETYPRPVVDHEIVAREFLKRYQRHVDATLPVTFDRANH